MQCFERFGRLDGSFVAAGVDDLFRGVFGERSLEHRDVE